MTKSWSDQETLEELAEKFRFQEIVPGVIRSVMPMKLPVVRDDGTREIVEEDTLIVQLPSGVTGYCVASEFGDYKFHSFVRFIGSQQNFIITDLNLENQIALLSEKKASAIMREKLWDEILELSESGELENKVYDAVVSGYSQEKGIIYLRINGQDAYMYRKEWSWYDRDVVDAQPGETIQVKIELFDKDQHLLRVSRRKALPDPFDYLSTLRKDQLIAGKVAEVHPIHGLFVEVENGVVLKAGKLSRLEEPSIGDIVTCRVQRVQPEERKGKVMIIDYPRGKRKKKDLGAFLFE